MSGDLVGGHYPLGYTFPKVLGGPSNALQNSLAGRSNIEYLGLNGLADTAAALITGELTVVAVPVKFGDIYAYVDVLVGATPAGTPAHSWAALYNAAGALVGEQSADGGSGAIAASGRFSFALGAQYQANATDSPGGWLYVAVSVTATTVPSLVTVGGTLAAGAQYEWYSKAPAQLVGAGGTALGATAPATLPSIAAKTLSPAVILR